MMIFVAPVWPLLTDNLAENKKIIEAVIGDLDNGKIRCASPIKSEEFKKKMGRNNYSTPKNYLDFLENFKKI